MVGFKKLIHLLIEHLNKSFNVNLTWSNKVFGLDPDCVITMPASHQPTAPVEDSNAGPEQSVVKLDLRHHNRVKLVPYGKKDKGRSSLDSHPWRLNIALSL
jgi:hypothetical protein